MGSTVDRRSVSSQLRGTNRPPLPPPPVSTTTAEQPPLAGRDNATGVDAPVHKVCNRLISVMHAYTVNKYGKQVRSRFIARPTTWPSVVAGAAANRLQDCCCRISVSAWTCSGVPVCWSTEHQGPAVETATTVTVVGHASRPDVEAVHCRRCTSLEHSVAGRSIIQFFIYIQTLAEDWAFLAKLPWLNSWIFVTL